MRNLRCRTGGGQAPVLAVCGRRRLGGQRHRPGESIGLAGSSYTAGRLRSGRGNVRLRLGSQRRPYSHTEASPPRVRTCIECQLRFPMSSSLRPPPPPQHEQHLLQAIGPTAIGSPRCRQQRTPCISTRASIQPHRGAAAAKSGVEPSFCPRTRLGRPRRPQSPTGVYSSTARCRFEPATSVLDRAPGQPAHASRSPDLAAEPTPPRTGPTVLDDRLSKVVAQTFGTCPPRTRVTLRLADHAQMGWLPRPPCLQCEDRRTTGLLHHLEPRHQPAGQALKEVPVCGQVQQYVGMYAVSQLNDPRRQPRPSQSDDPSPDLIEMALEFFGGADRLMHFAPTEVDDQMIVGRRQIRSQPGFDGVSPLAPAFDAKATSMCLLLLSGGLLPPLPYVAHYRPPSRGATRPDTK